VQLPNCKDARVPKEKITDYLLVPEHPDAERKAPFFLSCGFRSDGWEVFADALKRHAARFPVAQIKEIPFGIIYTVEGLLDTPPDGTPTTRPVRSAWIVENEKNVPRLVSAYPIGP
jgi:hypothetical protein